MLRGMVSLMMLTMRMMMKMRRTMLRIVVQRGARGEENRRRR